MTSPDPYVTILAELDAAWSPDLDAYAAGLTNTPRCVLCQHPTSCCCPPFGSDAYWALLSRVHRFTPPTVSEVPDDHTD